MTNLTRHLKRFPVGLLLVVALPAAGWTQGQQPSKVVAVVNGQAITEDQLRGVASADLDNLDARRVQFEATWARDRYNVLETKLNEMIAQRLIDAEAAKRAITKEALVAAEVDGKIPPPADAAVNELYELNKDRLSQDKNQALDQVRQFMRQQGYQQAYQAFVDRLRTEHKVENRFDAYRIEVETGGHPTLGPDSAPVTLVEFSDFECPYCSTVTPTLKRLYSIYDGKIRRVFRQFPLTQIHPNALKAAEASLCAEEKGKFWEMHDLLFQDQTALGVEELKKKAVTLGIDAAEFNACLDSGKHYSRVRKDLTDGAKAGVTGTPAVFLNGRFVNGAKPYEEFARIVEEELKRSVR